MNRATEHPEPTTGFTLVELLVVITIIVVLLSILAPAMDQAIYQAELAVCGTRLKGIADGLSLYAVDFHRRYPHRPQASGDPGWKPNNIYVGGAIDGTPTGNPFETAADDRKLLKGYLSINGHFNDLLSPREVDFEYSDPQTQIEVSYHLWYGWQYNESIVEKGMFKVGDRFTWSTGDRQYTFDFLASDVDGMDAESNAAGSTIAGHPDKDGQMRESVLQDGSDVAGTAETDTLQYTFSRWYSETGRGVIDTQFVSSDTSVRRYIDVPHTPPDSNPQMVRTPMWPSGYPFGQWQVHLGL